MNSLTVPSMQDLLSAGVHFGHQTRRGHPRMSPYIYGARDGVHIIDLALSEQKLKEATEAAYELGKNGGVLLVVGTKKQARDIVEELAKQAGTPYLNSHWVGGLLTNFEEIKKNFRKLNTQKEEQQKGQLSHYTKKEQLLISKKLLQFERELGGVAEMNVLPDALFIVDAVSDNTAVKEALKMGIKLFGFSDTNADPTWFDYPIPANDDGIKSIKLICETVLGAYQKGKEEAGQKAAQAEKKLKEEKDASDKAPGEKVDSVVAEQAAIIEEEVEKKVLQDSERKV